MAIAKGTCLGPYEIEEAIGAGGMGEVYRARDTRLDRVVAIKVLPDHLAQSPELRQRMEREAKAVSSLSHPNICALYDIGHEDGVDYLVMEFIDGETLGERLSQGPMPLEDSLRYGVEIADALEKAHRQGIVHRDIKPGNIMLTASGAKLLDFGLAKADGGLDGDADLTVSPTVSKPLTTAGTVLGTYQYMAPEQLEGKEVDARTDIFSLGAVLYEMVTGRRAFAGGSQASLIGAIMTEQPAPASTVQPMTPPAFDRVIQTCLSKDPEERWQTAHDVKLQLQWIAEGGSVVGLPAPVAARRKSRERLAWVAAAVAGVVAVLFAVGFILRAPEAPRQVRFEIAPDAKLAQVGSPRISPDGSIIAFQAIDSDGNGQIWLRPLDSIEARPLAGTEGTVTDGRPMWSPDSRYVAFFAGGKLKKVPVAGGPAQTICDANGADGSWSTQGEIVFDGQSTAPLMRVAAAGGIAKPEVSPAEFEDAPSLGWPEFLPGGKRFLFMGDVAGEETMIMLHEVGTSENIALTPADSRVQYAEPGYLIYVLDGMLVAHPFDAGKGELTGEPMPLADNVGSSAVGLADFSAADDGTLVFRSGESGGRRLLWYDRAGLELGTVAEGSEFRNTCLSPGASKVVSGIADDDSGNRDLWIHDLDRGVASRFTFDPAADSNPLWSPDGKQIVFSSTRNEKRGLYLKDASGVGPAELLLEVEDGANANSWSSDGRFLLYNTRGAETSWDIWALPMDGSAEAFPVLQSEFAEVRPNFSPDGKWFSYGSNESGRFEVYVRQFPGPGGQWQVSTDGGSESAWSADGREIFFIDAAGNLSVVPVETGATFTAGLPEVLFDPAVFPTVQRNRYLATSDGERFLVLATMSGESIRPTTVVLNWSAGLDN